MLSAPGVLPGQPIMGVVGFAAPEVSQTLAGDVGHGVDGRGPYR